MLFDTDRNRGTGCILGAERAFLVGGVPGPDVYGLGRCVNGDFVYDNPPRGTFQARYDETNRQLVIVATPADFANATSFNFAILSLWRDRLSQEVRLDLMPDGAVYCFPSSECGSRGLR